MENAFLELHKKSMELTGFWAEEYKVTTINYLLTQFKTEIIRDWYIEDIIINDDKILMKWQKRIEPLTDKELKEKYGRKI